MQVEDCSRSGNCDACWLWLLIWRLAPPSSSEDVPMSFYLGWRLAGYGRLRYATIPFTSLDFRSQPIRRLPRIPKQRILLCSAVSILRQASILAYRTSGAPKIKVVSPLSVLYTDLPYYCERTYSKPRSHL